MARYRRQIAPGSVQHIISRFVNREFRLAVEDARAEYLRQAKAVFRRSDWNPLAFALMSSHVHWAMRAGTQTSATVIKPLHVGFARWFNATQRCLGPVFADRHRSVTFEGETAAALIAYIHNNPVRAGSVSDPSESSWTSHRAYLGLESAPPWLDVELGLHLCGFSASPSGRLAFHDMVRSAMHEPRSIAFSGGDMQARRRRARERASGPVEIRAATVRRDRGAFRVEAPIVLRPTCMVRPRWSGAPEQVLHAISCETGVDAAQLQSRSREHSVSNARRLALITWARELHCPAIEMARLLGISSSSAAGLIRSASPDVRVAAAKLADDLRSPSGGSGRTMHRRHG